MDSQIGKERREEMCLQRTEKEGEEDGRHRQPEICASSLWSWS